MGGAVARPRFRGAEGAKARALRAEEAAAAAGARLAAAQRMRA